MLKRGSGNWRKTLWRTMALLMITVFMSAMLAPAYVASAAEADIETMKNSAVRVLITQGGRLMGKGSGFVIDDGKHIVTNYHVIESVETQGAQAWVVLGRGRDMRRALEIRATSRANDIAVLSVDQKLAKPSVKLVRREDIKPAESVIAVGFPGTSDQVDEDWMNAPATPTPGQVVQLLRLGGTAHMVQITADINPGNSGGPLVNMSGEVVGINSQILTPSGAFSGIALAIPINDALQVAEQLRTKGKVERGRVGVSIQPVTEDMAKELGLSKAQGVVIAQVEAGSPAAQAGLQTGDVVTKINGAVVESIRDFARYIGESKPGTQLQLEVWREGRSQNVEMTVGEARPEK